MQSRVILISDDDNFFEYIIPKLSLRRGDELFRFRFDEIADKVHLFEGAVVIINSEANEKIALELLDFIGKASVIVFSFNENSQFKTDVFRRGGCFYITLMTTADEFDAILTSAYQTASLILKNNNYREILVKNNLIMQNNEVYPNYKSMLEHELEKINRTSAQAVLLAIAPSDKTKFLLQANQIETIILNNIRSNDVLMNYAPNKYFLLLYDADMKAAEDIWKEIESKIPEKIYAGFANVLSKVREQIVDEVLNRLHEAIKNDEHKEFLKEEIAPEVTNFKLYRQEFSKKIDNIIEPVFYHVMQKYNSKLFGISLVRDQRSSKNALKIKSRHATGEFKITSPGFSNINIDITYQATKINSGKTKFPLSKRITLEPEELETGLLEDLLEQFINEFKEDVTGGDN